jgi:ribosomal protein L7Ae-like RNA K-turn-binding protein
VIARITYKDGSVEDYEDVRTVTHVVPLNPKETPYITVVGSNELGECTSFRSIERTNKSRQVHSLYVYHEF